MKIIQLRSPVELLRCDNSFKFILCEVMDWIQLAHCRVQWRVLVKKVMNCHTNVGNFLASRSTIKAELNGVSY